MSINIYLRTFIALCFAIFTHDSLLAQNQWKGQILDATSNRPITAASLHFPATAELFWSDEQGRISCYSPTLSSSDSIVFAAFGYQSLIMPFKNLHHTKIINLIPTETKLDEVIITGRRQDHLSTISTVDLNIRPVKSSQDVLRMVPGLFIAQHAGGGKAEQIFLRGFDIDHGTDIHIAVDELPVNMVSHAHGQGYADLHFLIPEIIETIDFGKGPYHSEYGNFATAGYVHFRTRERLIENQLTVEAGAFNTKRILSLNKLDGLLGKKQRSHGFIAGELLLSDGPFESPQDFNRLNIFGKYGTWLNEETHLRIQASAFNSKWNHSGQIPQRAIDQGLITRFGAIDDTEGGETNRKDVGVQLKQYLPNGGEIQHHAHFTQYDFQLFSNFTFFLNDPVNGDQIRQSEKRNIYGYKGKYHKRGFLGKNPVSLNSSWGLRYDKVKDNELSHTLNREEIIERRSFGNVNEVNAWLALQEELRLAKWTFSGSVRADYFQFGYQDRLLPSEQMMKNDVLVISPKLNVFFDYHSRLQMYAKAGRGFHTNDSRLAVRQNVNQTVPAAWGTEIGLLAKPVKGLLVNMATWYLFLEEEFVYVGDEGIIEPSGRSERYGLELSARYQLMSRLFADIDLNWTNARLIDEEKGADYIPLAPSFSSAGGITYQSNKGLSGALRYRYLGDRAANEDASTIASGYFVSDANISYRFSRIQLGIQLENIFDTQWEEAQFDTTSRLKNEMEASTEIHFTPGIPRAIRAQFSIFF